MTYGQYGKPKQCQNNCGQEIAWDKQANYFINTSNSQRHDCPKWEKKSSFTSSTHSVSADLGTQEQLARLENKIDKLEQMGSMLQWTFETSFNKVAKKLGVEDLTNDTSSSGK